MHGFVDEQREGGGQSCGSPPFPVSCAQHRLASVSLHVHSERSALRCCALLLLRQEEVTYAPGKTQHHYPVCVAHLSLCRCLCCAFSALWDADGAGAE